MTYFGDKLQEALNAKNNDVESFVWKFPKDRETKKAEQIRLIDATESQLRKFYHHCNDMLYSTDKKHIGRNILFELIQNQRHCCNVELFLRKLESGELCADKRPYPRVTYLQDLRAHLNANKDTYKYEEYKTTPITTCISNLPREYEDISIMDVIDGCLGNLGVFNSEHLTYSFILSLGIYLSPDELKELPSKDRMSTIKEKLHIKQNIMLQIIPSGLTYSELRAMLSLHTRRYSELTTEQLTLLKNTVLFRLEDKILSQINAWELRKEQIEKVASIKHINLNIVEDEDNVENIDNTATTEDTEMNSTDDTVIDTTIDTDKE